MTWADVRPTALGSDYIHGARLHPAQFLYLYWHQPQCTRAYSDLWVFGLHAFHIQFGTGTAHTHKSFIFFKVKATRNRNSSVEIATGWWARVWFPGEAWELSLLRSVQTGPVAHLASYSIGTGDIFRGDKPSGAWNWPLTSPTSAEIRWWSYRSTPPNVLMERCLIN
jgi:hypothetical protein